VRVQLEHEHQPPAARCRLTAPSPAQPWQPVPAVGAVAARRRGVAGDSAAGLSPWNPRSPQHLAGGAERGASLASPPGAAQAGAA